MSKHLIRARAQMKGLKWESLVDSSLDMHYKEVECAKQTQAKRDEYEAIYPFDREPTVDEEFEQYQDYIDSTVGEPLSQEEYAELYGYKRVVIEYNYCTYVPESGGEPIYSEEGNQIGNEPVVPESYEPEGCTFTFDQWLDGWTCPDYDTAHDIAGFKASDSEYRTYYKTMRQAKVDAIIVVLADGTRLDGDELAQGRMNNASSVMDDTEVTLWMSADNEAVSLTKAQLIEAQRKSGEAQTAIWMRLDG